MLRQNKIADISRETLRQILKAERVSWQATATWKAGKDPEFTDKMARILDLYDNAPADGRVFCVDEFGLPNLQPRAGRGWYPRRRPKRLRATYHRTHGVRTCSAHSIWPPARSAAASENASAGRNFWPSSRPFANGGRARSCT
ncbi:hypothetical protein ACQPW1_30005 [Nocardia sp. CA-128927]|uniref:hypothetical protein n=1 Tax=Nocardia sp. CA-128927 TaxID=3239975 RepID=UPI003D994CA7